MTHSPAPWKLEFLNGGIYDANGNIVCHWCSWEEDVEDEDDTIFHVEGKEPTASDGALLAAAPDLLYAGKRALMILAALANGIMVDESVIMQSGKELKAAISKAEPNEIK